MRHRMIAVRKDGGSFVLKGDVDEGSEANRAQSILPKLLNEGWHVSSTHMTASAAVNDDQVLGLIVLQRS